MPAMLPERIIGVTDPEDDTLVIWGAFCFVLRLMVFVCLIGELGQSVFWGEFGARSRPSRACSPPRCSAPTHAPLVIPQLTHTNTPTPANQ